MSRSIASFYAGLTSGDGTAIDGASGIGNTNVSLAVPRVLASNRAALAPSAIRKRPASVLASSGSTSATTAATSVEKPSASQSNPIDKHSVPPTNQSSNFTSPPLPSLTTTTSSIVASVALPANMDGMTDNEPAMLEGDFFSNTEEDEYDPFHPNEFEAVLRSRAQAHEQALAMAELRDRFEEQQRNTTTAPVESATSSNPEPPSTKSPTGMNTSNTDMNIIPPSSSELVNTAPVRGQGRGIDNRPAWLKKTAGSDSTPSPTHQPVNTSPSNANASARPVESGSAAPRSEPTPSAPSSSLSIGAKLMSKMGYVAGKGLGKNESGIVEPLLHLKTGERRGVILATGDAATPPAAPAAPRTLATVATPSVGNTKTVGNSHSETATRVVLLRNMAGAGEVDDDLEVEVKNECISRFGPVTAVFIYQCAAGVPDDEAVRIFVQFQALEDAMRAKTDLNGRYFGGRAVKATFYDENAFARFEFAPT